MDNQISKLADRPFVLGHFLPAALFILALALTHPGLLPGVELKIMQFEKWSSLASIALYSWLLAVMLALFNRELMRVLEGYHLPQSLSDRLIERQRKQYKKFTAELTALKIKEPRTKRDDLEFARIYYALLNRFPFDEDLLLPTRFGNVLRAFEAYSGKVYHADAVILWPRLVSVVSKDYMSLIGDGRARVNFFVNSLFLSGAFAITTIGLHLGAAAGGTPFAKILALQLSLTIGACAILGAIFLKAATHQAVGWGQLVKSAFDIYLPELAKQLGYKLPDTLDKQQQFWREVSQQAVYHRSLKPEHWERPTETAKSKDGKAAATPEADPKAGDAADEKKTDAAPTAPQPAEPLGGDELPKGSLPEGFDA